MTTLYSTGYTEKRNNGHSFAAMFDGGHIEVFGGTRPASPDQPANPANLLAVITADGQVAGPANGLRFFAQGRYITRSPDQPAWKMRVVASGMATWFRIVGPTDVAGASLTSPRIDGDVGQDLGSSEMAIDQATLVLGDIHSVPQWWHGTPPL